MKKELIKQRVIYAQIRKQPLFGGLRNEDCQQISASGELHYLKKKSVFPFRSEQVSRVFLLVAGLAKLVHADSGGPDHIVDFLMEGDVFGDLGLTGHLPEQYVVALQPNTQIVSFPGPEFHHLLRKHESLSMNYLAILGTQVRKLEDRQQAWTQMDARQRLRYFFRIWVDRAGNRNGNEVILENSFSLRDIAGFIGVSRQFMHIMLNELKHEGLVTVSRKQVIIALCFLDSEEERERQAV